MLASQMNEGIQKTLQSDAGKGFSTSNQVALQNAMALNTAKAKLQAVEQDLTDIDKQRYNQEIAMIQIQ
jgi:hypothetical protein